MLRNITGSLNNNLKLINMKNIKKAWYFSFVIIGLVMLNLYSCKKDGSRIPVLTTNSVSNITITSANCGGNITSNDGGNITARGVCWSLSPNPTTTDSKTNDGTGEGSFTSVMTGLIAGTKYYIRSYATNSAGTGYGNEYSFYTLGEPRCSLLSITGIRGNAANAQVMSFFTSISITNQGLCWGTAPHPTKANSMNTSYTDPISGLSTNTVYFVRAYITCVYGTFYSDEELSFNSGLLYGATFGGGLVFYNDGTGHGLVCASNDQSTSVEWGCSGSSILTSFDLNTGAANTNTIVALCSQAGIAARICYDLVLNSYSDWYLPSEAELLLIHSNLFLQGFGNLFVNTGKYWSSSQADDLRAYTVGGGGGYDYDVKYLTFGVRAVRSF